MQALAGVNIQAGTFQYSGSVNNTVKLASSVSPFQFCRVKFQQISVFLFVKNTFYHSQDQDQSNKKIKR